MKKSAEDRSSVTLLSNGLNIFGVLHMPKRSGRVPVVLFLHGFGGNKSGKFRLSVRQAEMLSRVGIASLRIDFRGSGDSEGNFADTTIKTQLEDARCALEFLQKHPNIDTQKIALLGRSLGGALATQLASEMDTCAAIALWCPLFDVKPWTSKHTGDEFRFLGQPLSPECIAEFLALDATSALSKIEEIPMLIISAGKDEILGSYHHEKYLSERKQATLHVALENSCHDFSYIPEQEKLLQITTSFLQGYL